MCSAFLLGVAVQRLPTMGTYLSPTPSPVSECLTKSKLRYDRRSVGQYVLVSSDIWGPRPDIYYCQRAAGLFMWGVLSEEKTGLPYSCCWLSAAQSFLGPSPEGLIFYCLWFETPPTYRSRSPCLCPPGSGCPSYALRHWVPFSSVGRLHCC
jgi:hypothetical protein